jgi:hypothetical protein
VPTSRAFKECASRFDTTPVDEFRTTALWNGDKEKGSGVKVRGLLWYYSTRQHTSKYINRDLNAALNILDCFLLLQRPTAMDRSMMTPPAL